MNFCQFAAASGLLSNSYIADGKIHRCATLKNPRAKNGAYAFDGQRGWCMDWSETGAPQWWNDPNSRPWNDQEKKDWAEKRRNEEKARIEGYQNASSKAAQMLAECVIDNHAYLRSKQLPEIKGMVNSDGALLIPMRDCSTNRVTGLQSIAWDEEKQKFMKKFIPGMRAKGSVFKIGAGKKIILVEGYATGLSIYAAIRRMSLDAYVMCCFSANNMIHVAKTHGNYVMADNDESKTGEKSAIETGLPWLMPDEVGTDWNDVHANEGLIPVCASLKEFFRRVA